jgi:hypothetical protein
MPPNLDSDEYQLIDGIIRRLSVAGIHLVGKKWDAVKYHPTPPTFYFTSSNWREITREAESSKKLHRYDPDDTPPSIADWRREGHDTLVYVETEQARPVRLEVMIDPPFTCRATILDAQTVFALDAKNRVHLKGAGDNDVYAEIANRMNWAASGFNLADHIAKIIDIGPTRLVGIDFIAKDSHKLIEALGQQKSGRFFRFVDPSDPTRKEHGDPLLLASLAATDGYGFREAVSDVFLDEPGASAGPRPIDTDPGSDFDNQARKFSPRPNIKKSALHCAISPQKCNIHIDEVAFVFYDADGKVRMQMERARVHTVDELGLKTGIPILAGFVGPGFKRSVESVIAKGFIDIGPNSTFISADVATIRTGKLTITAGCSNCNPLEAATTFGRAARFKEPKKKEEEFSLTLTYSGTHDIGSGRP